MRRICLFFVCSMLGFAGLRAQAPIPDGDFENWTSGNGGIPSSGWWTTLNDLRLLGGPVTVEKSSDAHSGSFSAQLTTKDYGSILVPGLLLSGDFNLAAGLNAISRGKPYTDRPERFKGWYKFEPVNGDSAAIAVQLMRWNSTTNVRDTVGEVGIVIRQAVNTWTEFDLPILYFNNDSPDSIIVVATSSADGANFNGQTGNRLWVDDFSLETATSTPEPEARWARVGMTVNQELLVEVDLPKVKMSLLSLSGQQLLQKNLASGRSKFNLEAYPSGIYLLRLSDRKGRVYTEKIALLHP